MDSNKVSILERRLYEAETLLAHLLHELEEEDFFLSHEIRDGIQQYTDDWEVNFEEVYSEFATSVGLD